MNTPKILGSIVPDFNDEIIQEDIHNIVIPQLKELMTKHCIKYIHIMKDPDDTQIATLLS